MQLLPIIFLLLWVLLSGASVFGGGGFGDTAADARRYFALESSRGADVPMHTDTRGHTRGIPFFTNRDGRAALNGNADLRRRVDAVVEQDYYAYAKKKCHFEGLTSATCVDFHKFFPSDPTPPPKKR